MRKQVVTISTLITKFSQMAIPQLLVVGRDSSLLQNIILNLKSSFKVTSVSRFTDVSFKERQKIDGIFIIHNPPEEDGFARLMAIQTLHKEIPLFFIEYNMPQKEQIKAHQAGVNQILNVQALENSQGIVSIKEAIQAYRETKLNDHPRLKDCLHNKIVDEFVLSFSSPIFTNHTFEAQPTYDLSIQMLGEFKVIMRGKTVQHTLSSKAKVVLAYLMMNKSKKLLRSQIATAIWKDVTTDCAKNNLNVTIHTLRKWFYALDKETQYIISNGEYYEINQSLKIETDVDHFWTACRSARQKENSAHLSTAIMDYFKAYLNCRGLFMEDITNDEWVSWERDSLKEHFITVLEKIAQGFLAEQCYEIALPGAMKIIQLDSCIEKAYQIAMECNWKMQKRKEALRLFDKCKTELKKELGIDVSSETLELKAKIEHDIPPAR